VTVFFTVVSTSTCFFSVSSYLYCCSILHCSEGDGGPVHAKARAAGTAAVIKNLRAYSM
jgi:hypothetical protein